MRGFSPMPHWVARVKMMERMHWTLDEYRSHPPEVIDQIWKVWSAEALARKHGG